MGDAQAQRNCQNRYINIVVRLTRESNCCCLFPDEEQIARGGIRASELRASVAHPGAMRPPGPAAISHPDAWSVGVAAGYSTLIRITAAGGVRATEPSHEAATSRHRASWSHEAPGPARIVEDPWCLPKGPSWGHVAPGPAAMPRPGASSAGIHFMHFFCE